MRALKVLVCVFLAVSVSVSWAAEVPGPSIHFVDEDGKLVRGVRCGTASPNLEVEQMVETIAAKSVRQDVEKMLTIVPVAVHVIHGSNGQGDVSDQQIANQIQILDSAFVGSDFSFVLDRITRTENPDWFADCADETTEITIRTVLAVDPAHTLNLYTCDPDGLLGRATFPWDHLETSTRNGVMVKHSTLPGGTLFPYNEGHTAVHEVGHYLGLYHTFHNGCSALSDYVVDTPHEASEATGCPVGRDTCRKGGGADPIHNYMNYSDDLCTNEFTPGQWSRMQTMVAAYRPSL